MSILAIGILLVLAGLMLVAHKLELWLLARGHLRWRRAKLLRRIQSETERLLSPCPVCGANPARNHVSNEIVTVALPSAEEQASLAQAVREHDWATAVSYYRWNGMQDAIAY